MGKTKAKKTKVLFVTAECSGFAPVGGLAEVAGSLPQAIMAEDKNFEVKVVMPLYKKIMDEYHKDLVFVGEGSIVLAWRSQYVGVFTLKKNGVDYYFVDNKYYFDRFGIYGHFDDGEKFAFFSKSIFEVMRIIDFYPNIIHANDWHSALVNIYLDILYKKEGTYMDIKSIFTIHNLEYQGIFGLEFLEDVIGIDRKYQEIIEYNGLVNLMKGAIVCSDLVTTVSPRYAREIATTQFGWGLENIIRMNKHKVIGIINGIDYDSYNPYTDKAIYQNYDIDSFDKKKDNKARLQAELGLEVTPFLPTLSVISRLVSQKGIDILIEAIQGLVDLGGQVIILGTGDHDLEDRLRAFSNNPNVKVLITYNGDLARKIYAGSDIFLMPSKFEPCGLSQMIASRYGAIPVVRETGGLYDTIQDYYANKDGNGFTFKDYSSYALYLKGKDAIELYRYHFDEFVELAKRCMAKDFSWNASAKSYIETYKNLLK